MLTALGVAVAIITYGTGRTNLLQIVPPGGAADAPLVLRRTRPCSRHPASTLTTPSSISRWWPCANACRGHGSKSSAQRRCPHFELIEEKDPYDRVTAAQLLARMLVDCLGDVVGAARLTRGLIDVVLPWQHDTMLWRAMATNLLTTYATLAVDAGMGQDLQARAPGWLATLERMGDRGNLADLRLKVVEAQITDGLYEAARDGLAMDVRATLPAPLRGIHERLSQKIEMMLRRPDEVRHDFDPQSVLDETLAYLREAQPDATVTRVLEDVPLERLTMGAFGFPAFPDMPKTLAELDAASQALPQSRTPLASLSGALEKALDELQAPGKDAAGYHALAIITARIATAARGFGYWEASVEAAWIQTLALRRAGEHQAALGLLLDLAAQLDERRRLIREPRLRAALAIHLPHLAWVLTETAARVGAAAAALHGVEMTKGRVLGDLRTGGDAAAKPEALLAGLRARLSPGRRVHVVAFLADALEGPRAPADVGIRAVLLAADGSVHLAEIPLTEAALKAVADQINRLVEGAPRSRDQGSIFVGDVWRRPFEPALAAAAPLVAWLEPLLDAGVLRTGDALVHAGDGSLHNIPLGMLPFAGGVLIEAFACVSMPSLMLAMQASPAPRPASALAVLGPMPAERAAGDRFEDEAEVLRRWLEVDVVSDIGAARRALAAPRHGLVHVAAHGGFDPEHPLRRGGIVLPDEDGRYDPRDPAFALSPEALGALKLDGMHLTLRACIVGRMQQVTSREALGPVWGLLSAGAASLVAASWHVDRPSAARWAAHFYEAWLGHGMTRAQAHRAACLALRAEGGALAHPCHWAPFVLYTGTLEGDVA